MKLNNKGYAITVIVFGILIVFIIVLSSLLVTMNNSVKLNNVVKEDIIENIQLNADTTGMSLTERLEQLELQMSNIKKDTINEIYPVGSIYISTTDDSIDDVVARFGGEWETYSEGRTLVGVGTSTDSNGNVATYTENMTGGNQLTTLDVNNIPLHNHIVPSLNGTAENNGAHTHSVTNLNGTFGPYSNAEIGVAYGSPNQYFIIVGHNFNTTTFIPSYNVLNNEFTATSNGEHAHTVTTTASSTTMCTNCNGASFSNESPYITVYMYKRIK